MELTLPDGTKITQGSQTPPPQPTPNGDTPPPPPVDGSNLTSEPSPNNQALPPPSTDSTDPQPSVSDSVPSSWEIDAEIYAIYLLSATATEFLSNLKWSLLKPEKYNN